MNLRQSFHRQSRVVIIGGGVIGLEAACAAAKCGCDVTVVENQERLLARAFPDLVSKVVEARHRNNGVRFEFGVSVAVGNGERRSFDQWSRTEGGYRARWNWS